MILGSITYRDQTILDFSPHWVIGSPGNHIAFRSLEDAKQWIDEVFRDQHNIAWKKEAKAYADELGYQFSEEDLTSLLEESYFGEDPKAAIDDYLDAYER